jgi:predicted SprT family Zn-dependent metalloprotease
MLLVDVERSSLSKTARSVLRQIMAVDLCHNFSWKGQQRKDQEEKKEAFQSLMISKLLRSKYRISNKIP